MFAAQPAAKINLTLAVGPRGDDGYHPLRSVFLRIGLTDELAVAEARGAEEDQLTVSGMPGCPVQGNLVLRAFDSLRAATGLPLPALAARLEKRIPIAAGLGGGSSDGAAALALAAACWGVGLAPAEHQRLAVGLGSDVPFFAADCPAALVAGTGEQVTPLPPLHGDAGVLLATSARPLGAGQVYARFDELEPAAENGGRAAERATDELVLALRAGLDGAGLAVLAERLRDGNELWPAAAALAPELVPRRGVLEDWTGRPWLLTGSGPTLFAIYASREEAETERSRLAAARSDVALIATSVAEEPASGREP